MNQSGTSQGTAGLAIAHQPVTVEVDSVQLDGYLSVPTAASGVVLFAHGSGSSRHSPRNRSVADLLNESGLATLLIDLLTEDEQEVDLQTAHLRFNIPFLAKRLVAITGWLEVQQEAAGLKIGHFGASTGAAAALVAAAELPRSVHAVVSRGGRPDLAGDALALCESPHATHRRRRGPGSTGSESQSDGTDALRERARKSFPARRICSKSRARSARWRAWRATGSWTN